MLTRMILITSLSLCSVFAFANIETANVVKTKYLKVEKVSVVKEDRLNVSVCSKEHEQDAKLNCDETYSIDPYWFLNITEPKSSAYALKKGKENAGTLSLYPFLLMFDRNQGLPHDLVYFPLFLLTVPAGLISYPLFLGNEFYKLEKEKRTEAYKLRTEMHPFVSSSEATHVYSGSPEAIEILLEKIKIWGRKI